MKKTKSKLLSDNTAQVTIGDISKSGGILSAEFHTNKLKGKKPYTLKDGKYVPANPSDIKKADYLTEAQVLHINNLLTVQIEISNEISKIKKTKNYKFDDKVIDTKLSNRAKNACMTAIFDKKDNDVMLRDIAKIPLRDLKRRRGMGEGTVTEIRRYLTANGFILQ